MFLGRVVHTVALTGSVDVGEMVEPGGKPRHGNTFSSGSELDGRMGVFQAQVLCAAAGVICVRVSADNGGTRCGWRRVQPIEPPFL